MKKVAVERAVFIGIALVAAYTVLLAVEYGVSSSAYERDFGMIVRDTLKPGEHHLSGSVVLPSECDTFTVRTTPMENFRYHLSFETWREPQRDCDNVSVQRPFETVVFAPSFGVWFTADLEGEPLPLTIIPSIVY